MKTLIERFIRYVKIDTQSDFEATTTPSTEKQKNLSKILVEELKMMGYDAFLDDLGYTYTKIPGNVTGATPIGFVAHVDTSPDAPGKHVNPRMIRNYDGKTIQLNEELSMDPKQFPSLLRVVGEDIIVTDGNTLLGADDKAGVAEIMELADYFAKHSNEPHGDIYICFTPDEEIGKGADHFNHNYFQAKFAYTADGSEVGGIEYENFNAADAFLTFKGKSIHPGSAKDKLVNALHIAFEFHQALPSDLDPAKTEGYEGFNHLNNLRGEVERATSRYIIRNHDRKLFEQQKKTFSELKEKINTAYGYEAVDLELKDSYFNMHEIIKDHMYIVDLANEAIRNVGVTPFTIPIRGGTDGARLTFDGLPCPNLGTGGYQFHGRYEFVSIQQMELATKILIEIAKLAATKTF